MKIISKELLSVSLNPRIIRISVLSPFIAAKFLPGQFAVLMVSEKGERIPLTIVSSDREKGTISLIFQETGGTTGLLSKMDKGQSLYSLTGPLGSPLDVKHYGEVILVSGGIGTAEVFPVSKALKTAGNKVNVISGARTENLLILENELKRVSDKLYICTDDGSYGRKGNVTLVLKELLSRTSSGKQCGLVYTVGPISMMREVSNITRERKIETVACLNSLILDGTGMCGSCRVTVKGKVKFTCVDGPNFDAHSLDWDEIEKRNSLYVDKERIGLFRELPPAERIDNFSEVSLGYTEDEAVIEAERCLQCEEPACISGCPVGVDIKKFIYHIQRRDFKSAYLSIKDKNNFPSICGRVCPAEYQCRKSCVLNKNRNKPFASEEAVNINLLERFIGDWGMNNYSSGLKREFRLSNENKTAVIGAGPAGLSAAGELARKGGKVVIFESLHKSGGALRYGIPQFRLPDEVLDFEIDYLKQSGVKIVNNFVAGKTVLLDDLFDQGFKSVFLGTGAGTPKFLGIKGEGLNNVYSANEFLTRINLMKAYKFPSFHTPVNSGKKIVVIGGGNTALDAARSALRLQKIQGIMPGVTVLYRRTEVEMPVRRIELKHAKDEGVKFGFLTQPLEFFGNDKGFVKKIKCLRCRLGLPDDSGRSRPVPIEGSEFYLNCDLAIVAVGLRSNQIFTGTIQGLKLDRKGYVLVSPETMGTSIKGVYAGGDVVGGVTVIEAMGMAKKAVKSMP